MTNFDSDIEPVTEVGNDGDTRTSVTIRGLNITMEYLALTEKIKSTDLRSNFPLPREIRNQILSNLLDAEQVRKEPTEKRKIVVKEYHDGGCGMCKPGIQRYTMADDRHWYKFDVAILRVNHEVFQEASEILYGANDFVVVSWSWSGIAEDFDIMGVLIICRNRNFVARVKDHRIRIHLEWPKNKLACRGGRDEEDTGAALMMSQDLHLLTRMFRVQNFRIVGDCVMIIGPRDCKSVAVKHSRDTIKVIRKAQLRETSYGRPSDGLQQLVLDLFMEILGVGHKIIITGVDKRSARNVSEVSSPRVVRACAMRWNLFPLLIALKDDADRAFLAGNLELAFHKYMFISRVSETAIIPDYAMPMYAYRCLCRDAENALRFLMVDICTMAMSIGLKLGKKWCKTGAVMLKGNNLSKDSIGMKPDQWYKVKHWAAVTAMEVDWYENYCLGVMIGMRDYAINENERIDAGILKDLHMVETWLEWNRLPQVRRAFI